MASPVLYRIIWGSKIPPTASDASRLRIQPAMLHAYKRYRIKNKKYPAILPTAFLSSVRGVLIEGLTDSDLWRLDIFEGSEYARQKVRVSVLKTGPGDAIIEATMPITQNGELEIEREEVEAEVYVWIDDKGKLETGEWDFTEFVNEEMRWWVGREATDMQEGFQGRASINGKFFGWDNK